MHLMRRLGIVTALLKMSAMLTTTVASAQDIRGTVVESNDSTRVSGAVVLLLHATTDAIYNRTLTGERGAFTLRAPAGIPVRVRVLRIGYQATNAGRFTLAAGQVENIRIKLADKRVVLATFDVAGTNRCEVRPDSARLVAQLYEEARKALIASATPMNGVTNQTQFSMFNRQQDERGKLLAPIKRRSFAGPSSKPFSSLSPDSLAKVGYVVDVAEGRYYHAPDADVLLSETFLASHCLQLVNGTGERSASIGIGFRPLAKPGEGKPIVDVRGTLWLDRESSELQYLEYEYVGVPDQWTRSGVGGRVDYMQMSGGIWFVNKWAIRMPLLKPGATVRRFGDRESSGSLAGLEIGGGEVQWFRMNADTLYSNPSAVLAGSDPRDVREFASAQTQYDVQAGWSTVKTPAMAMSVDTVFETSSCRAVLTEGYTGQVQGKVRDAAKRSDKPLSVIAEWKEDFKLSGKNDFTWQVRMLEIKVTEEGDYVFCGLPLKRGVSVFATDSVRKSRVAVVRLTAEQPRATMNLSMASNTAGLTAGAGTRARSSEVRIVDPFNVPIAFATVVVGGTGSRVADEDGRVALNMAPRDSLRLLVRRIGYSAFDGMSIRDSATGAFRVTLAPTIQKLGTVTVNDRMTKTPLELTGFYERVREVQRGALRGEFFTPEDLNARPSGNIAQFLQASRFVQAVKGRGSWVIKGRSNCPMAVVLDGVQVKVTTNPDSAPGGDITDLAPLGQISAIEVYPSVANSPTSINFAVKDGNCGVIAIWTGGRSAK